MRKYFIVTTLIAGLLILWGCEKEQDNPVLNLSNAVPASLTTPAEGSSFDLETFEDNFVFSWSPANYNIDDLPNITYRIVAYLGSQENNFREHMIVLSETTATSDTVSATRMNQVAFQLGAAPFEFEGISFRVMSYFTLGSEATWLFSSPLTIDVRSFELFTMALVPGTYQGWDFENTSTVLYSPNADNQFEGFLFFEEPNTEIFISMGTSGLFVYGDDDGNGVLDADGAPIVIAEPGVYRIRVDYDAGTYEIFRTVWALIGSAADGWDTDVVLDVDMDFWEQNWKVRYVIVREMVVGAFKFRANGQWDPENGGTNMGTSDEEGVLQYFGFGNDIPVDEAGTYEIIFDLSGPLYTFELNKQ